MTIFEAAKPKAEAKKPDAPAQASMRESSPDKVRRNPSTDQRRIRREMQKKASMGDTIYSTTSGNFYVDVYDNGGGEFLVVEGTFDRSGGISSENVVKSFRSQEAAIRFAIKHLEKYNNQPDDPEAPEDWDVRTAMQGVSLDNCPVCARRIYDNDSDGMEMEDGQRWCVQHAPSSEEPLDNDADDDFAHEGSNRFAITDQDDLRPLHVRVAQLHIKKGNS
jgi:hypothetical protein